MIDAIAQMFSYDFMQRAWWGLLLLVPLFALLGTLVVNQGLSFFSDALGHSALTGVGLGVLLGLSDQTPIMLLFAALFALAMNAIRRSRLSSSDTVIGVFSSCGVALGLVLLSRGEYHGYQRLLIGDILSITDTQLWVLGGALVVVFVVWLLCFNGFFAVSVSPSLARSRSLPVRWLDDLLVVMLAAVVMLALRFVGLLLINAMLILPAAAARNIARGWRNYLLLTLLFGLFSGALGLTLSFLNGFAAGPTIVLVNAAVFFGTFLMSRRSS